MIEILNLPEPNIAEFKESLRQRDVQHRVTWKIPPRISHGLVRPKSLQRTLSWRIKHNRNPVVIGGIGSYHHLTYGLCANLRESFGYVHIDRHSDFGDKNEKYVCMGGFVDRLLASTSAEAGLLIGCDERKEIPTIPYNRLDELERRIDAELRDFPETVYVSVDLDVLSPSEFNSGYDTGMMTIPQLFFVFDRIASAKRIVGGDIFGYAGNDERSLNIAVDCILKIHDSVYKE